MSVDTVHIPLSTEQFKFLRSAIAGVREVREEEYDLLNGIRAKFYLDPVIGEVQVRCAGSKEEFTNKLKGCLEGCRA